MNKFKTMKNNKKPQLTMIKGGLQCEMEFCRLRIVASPEHSPPFDVDAIAYEEDTFLIMSADTEIVDPGKNIMTLMTNLIEIEPEPLGSVKIISGNPIKFLAIIHDVDREPTWEEEWIENSLREIFLEIEKRKLSSFALPLLGTLYGNIEIEGFLTILKRIIEKASIKNLRHLWLIVPDRSSRDIINLLKTI